MKHFNLLKTTLLLCALIVGSLSGWAEKTTIASFSNSNTSGWTINGSPAYSSTGGYQLVASSMSIVSPAITWENYTNITITISARTYGGPNDTQKVIYVSQEGTDLTTISPTTKTLSSYGPTDIKPTGTSSLTICCKGASSSKGSGVSIITIEGEPASSDPQLSVSDESIAFGDVPATSTKQLTFSVTPSNLTSGLNISCNNSKYTVSPASISKDATGAQTITVTANPTSVNDDMDGKITISGDDFADDTEVTLSTTVIRKSPALAFDPTSISLTRGESFTAPSFSKDAGIPFSSISFSSSYNDVATVSDEGVISLGTSTGTAIIKANFEQTDVYAAGTATCTVTVNPAGVTPEPNAAGYYQKVTDTKDITDGKYLIVYETDGVAFDGSRATLDAGENTKSISITDDKVDSDDDVDAISFTLASYDGGFSIQSASGKYIGRSTSSNGMDADDSKIKNTISISSGNAVIEGTGGYQLRFNSASGTSNYRFRYYASNKQKAVQLYKFVAGSAPSDIDIYVSAAGYSTYASNFDLDFTSVTNLKAYIAKEDNGAIKMVQVNKVPKGTGMLLRATDGGEKNYTVLTATTTDDITGNLFVRGNDEAVASDNGSNHNYILNVKNNQLGFYKANDNTVAKNRAYLQTTVAASRINLNFDEETTGIAEVKTNAKNEIFNINGQRVEKTAKGLYIMNGKKFIVK